MKLNPFKDSGIANYEQYKLYQFIIFGTLDILSKRIDQSIYEIKNNYYFGERLILIGQRGLGKTSTLFYVKDKLDKSNIKNYTLSSLIEDFNHFELISKDGISITDKEPIYILIDFPDTVANPQFKKFLLFLWELLTHPNYAKINLIFAMNHSHFNKSFSLSEIFGKFTTLRLEPFNFDECTELLNSRLSSEESFSDEVLEVIYNYSKGIPRNIISAGCLLFDMKQDMSITKLDAGRVLNERYFDQVINDRVDDYSERIVYKQIIDILKNKFNGIATTQMEFIKECQKNIGIGRISIKNKIDELSKFGILHLRKGGDKRLNKIISLE